MSSITFDLNSTAVHKHGPIWDDNEADHTLPKQVGGTNATSYDPNIARIKAATSAAASLKRLPDPIQTRPSTASRLLVDSPREGSAGNEKAPTGLRVRTGANPYIRDLPLRKTSADGPPTARFRADTASGNEAERSFFGSGLLRATSSEVSTPGATFGQDEAPRYVHTGRSGPLQTLRPDDILRPTTAREHAISDMPDLPPTPGLRTSDSVPNHRFLRYVHPKSSTGPRSRDERFYNVPAPSSRLVHQKEPPSLPSPVIAVTKEPRVPPVRESAKSAATQISSPVDFSSTARSSISTNITSASELMTPNTPWSIKPNDEELSIDDCIALYAEGFHDDPPAPSQQPSPPRKTIVAHPRRKSSIGAVVKIEVPKIEVPALPVPPTPSSGRVTSEQMFAGELTPNPMESEPQLLEPESDPDADRYGFKKSNRYVSLEEYEKWNAGYQPYLDRRRQKWNDLMRQHKLSTGDAATEFPPRSDRVKRHIRKGIPPEWRGAAWFWYAGGPARLAKNRGLYDSLIERAAQKGQLGEGDAASIERDLHRTFPDNDLFKRYNGAPSIASSRTGSVALSVASGQTENMLPERPMIGSLRRVLQAFAIYQPKIGYCQSLNFLAGQLLLFLHRDEEKAFHLLCILTSEHLPGTHGLNLDGANADISVLMHALKDSMPALWARLDDRTSNDNLNPTSPATNNSRSRSNSTRSHRALPTVSLATTPWLMSAFVSTLPPESCARVWDVLWSEGSKSIFRVCLGIFRLGEAEIRAIPTSDPAEVFQVVQSLPRRMIDANALMEASFGENLMGRGLLGGGTVGRRRKEEMRDMMARERAGSILTPPATPVDGDGMEAEPRRSLSRNASFKGLARLKSMRRAKAPPVPAPPLAS